MNWESFTLCLRHSKLRPVICRRNLKKGEKNADISRTSVGEHATARRLSSSPFLPLRFGELEPLAWRGVGLVVPNRTARRNGGADLAVIVHGQRSGSGNVLTAVWGDW